MCLIKFILFNIVINFNLINAKQNQFISINNSKYLVNSNNSLVSTRSFETNSDIDVSSEAIHNISDTDLNDAQIVDQFNDKPIDVNNDLNETDYDFDSDDDYSYKSDFPPNQLIADHLIDKLFDGLSNNQINNSSNNETNEVFQKLWQSYETLLNFVKPIEMRSSQRLFELLYSSDLSEQCLAALITTTNAFNSQKLWAFKMIDSIGKIPSGLVEGVFTSLGEYDECLNIKSESQNHEKGVSGKYCLAKPLVPIKLIESLIFEKNSKNKTPEQFKILEKIVKENANKIKFVLTFDGAISKANFELFRIGICIPSKCSSNEIEDIFNKILRPRTGITVSIGPECDSKSESNNQNINTFHLIAVVILSTLLVFVMLGTITEFYHQNSLNPNLWTRFSMCFSFISNTKSIFEAKSSRISSADGILVTYILWTFIARSYLSPLYIGAIGLKNVFTTIPSKVMTDLAYFWVRTPFPNETIIIISAFIISYNYFGLTKVRHNFSIYLSYCFLRWIKLSRRLIGPILVVYILSEIGSGPLWSNLKPQFSNGCQTHYLPSLLLFNNYFEDFDELCNSSYLAPVFQLQIMSPFFLFILRKGRRIGYILLINLVIFGTFATISPKLFSEQRILPFEISLINSLPQMKRSIIRYTQYTDQYIISFAMGSLLGYAVQKQANWKISKSIQILLWIICPTISLVPVIWAESFIYYNQNIDQKQISLMLCYSLGKVMFNIGIGWCVYACSTGRGGIINEIMDSRILRPFSRLSITFLVLHSIIINYRMFTRKEVYVMTHTSTIEKMITDFILSLGLSFILHLLIEEPINRLIKFKFKTFLDNKGPKKDDRLLKTRNNVVLKYIFPKDNNF